jgi:hypothetical protein
MLVESVLDPIEARRHVIASGFVEQGRAELTRDALHAEAVTEHVMHGDAQPVAPLNAAGREHERPRRAEKGRRLFPFELLHEPYRVRLRAGRRRHAKVQRFVIASALAGLRRSCWAQDHAHGVIAFVQHLDDRGQPSCRQE